MRCEVHEREIRGTGSECLLKLISYMYVLTSFSGTICQGV